MDERALHEVQATGQQAVPYLMGQLFALTKALHCYTMVVAMTGKEVPTGVEFPYDVGRGGNKKVDYCDMVFTAWMPEDERGLSDDERRARAGQLRVFLSKNRSGPRALEHLVIEPATGRVLPTEIWSERDAN